MICARVGTAAVTQTVPGSAQTARRRCFFDVFGILVDWRTGIAREADAQLKPRDGRPGRGAVSRSRFDLEYTNVLIRRPANCERQPPLMVGCMST